MNTIDTVIVVLAFLVILRTAVTYVHLWFVKEYRTDRMLIHLGTKQGRGILFPPFRLPPKSPKTIVLAGMLTVIEAAIVLGLPYPRIVNILVGYLALFPVSWVLVAALGIPTLVLHTYRIDKAVRRLREHTPMTVVGLTGSYGKTSTKEFLATILATDRKTLKTAESKNSPIGIAETVLANLTDSHRTFVVEMGAYRPGEIARMASMVRPQIGIVTAINAQHQDLFKNIETTKKAKYELLAGLTGKRIAIVNADNPHVAEMGAWAKRDGCTLWGYGTSAELRTPAYDERFVITGVRSDDATVSFSIGYRGKTYPVAAPIWGEHFAWNLTAAIAGAVASGMEMKDAVRAASSVANVRKVLQLTPGPKGSVFINDTFNNNPDAAVAALSFLAKYNRKRILVFQPMIELGEYARESHIRVGKYAASVCDAIVLTNENFSDWFIHGAKEGNPAVRVVVKTGSDAAGYLAPMLSQGDAVLFKGKEAESVLKAFSVVHS
jgi:UDP-N-acetylmuramoyl-tripeptide--D-alanyl-D-alanine ligase